VTEQRRSFILVSAAIAKGWVQLGRETYTLGRGKDCLIPLNSTNVSRKHCEIAWAKQEKQGYWLTDLGSTNGTFVNGQKVTKSRKLDLDDTISLGDVAIRFLCVEGDKEEIARRYDPRAEETSKLHAGTGPAALLAGRIAPQVLQEVCQLIELSRRSGSLNVRCQGVHGAIKFRDGMIVDARLGTDSGEKVARRLLGFSSGEYTFGPAEKPPEGPLKLRAVALLMDLARAEDESEKTRRMPKMKKKGDEDSDFTDKLPSKDD
jgi:pSer/pThr/pTyr-binding forkhead associated (FHA) protein